jgi:hypothetical protein
MVQPSTIIGHISIFKYIYSFLFVLVSKIKGVYETEIVTLSYLGSLWHGS